MFRSVVFMRGIPKIEKNSQKVPSKLRRSVFLLA